MAVLTEVKPERVFHFFEELCKIPHGTFDTKRISDYCVAFAKEEFSIKALEEGFSEDDLKAAGEEVAAALKPGEALGDMGQLIGDSLDSLDVVRESKKD